MKRKYYLRGLGIGILVSVVIMSISAGQKRPMTDEEIKARARELGMVESTVLSNLPGQTTGDKQPEETKTSEETKEPEETTTPEETKEPEETKVPEETGEPEETTTPEETKEPEEIKTPEETQIKEEPEEPKEPDTVTEPDEAQDTVTIVIKSGESSVTVSKSLAAAGLVEKASDYDRYLCENGYDKKIRTGTYEIPVGASEETIAQIITGKKR